MNDDLQHPELVSFATRALIHELRKAHGYPIDVVLATIHATVMAEIVAEFGGVVGAECARRTVERVEREQRFEPGSLAGMAAKGSA